MLLDDQLVLGQLVLGVDRHLRIVADGRLGPRDHRAGVGIGERDLAFAAGLQPFEQRSAGLAPRAHPGDLVRQRLFASAASAAGAILAAVDLVQLGQIALQPRVGRGDLPGQLLAREVAVAAVDRLQPRAVHRQQFAPEQIELAAQDDKGPEHRLEGGSVVAPEVRDGLEVRPQTAQQPDHLQIAQGLGFETPAGAHPVEIAVQVQLQ